jgi:quinohemoprotein ethanol dehydrogenase
MRLKPAVTVFCLAAVVAWLLVPAAAQDRTASTVRLGSMPRVGQAGNSDWPLHNLDVFNRRYSSANEIDPSNATKLTVKWSFDAEGGIAEITPLVVDGVMYFNSGSKLVALDAVTGKPIWIFQTKPDFPGGGRGPTYADGKIFAFGPSSMYSVDAKSGKLLENFGDQGLLRLVNKALEFKYPGKYPADLDPASIGYSMKAPTAYYNNTLYVGLALGDSHIPGGLLAAVDATTGAIKWVFNTIPQGPQDEGWEIAKDTWGSGARAGGGIWTQPAIDPELGMIYFNAGNPSPDYDGSARKGINLFTNSAIALNLATGKLVWFNQVVHHDIWDWDLVTAPVLFDVTVAGKSVKGIGVPSKTCYLYLWDRETGKPINPIVETPVPTATDVPEEAPWPTQPIPYTSRGVPQQPFCATYPIVADPELAKRVRPPFQPFLVNAFIINSPGVTGGSNYGPASFSPRTGLLYITGKNDAASVKVKPVGDTIQRGPTPTGYFGTIAERGETGMPVTTTLTAYDPATGQQVWYAQVPKTTNTGNLVTAGDVVFQGISSGDFYAFDARSGRELFKSTVKSGIRASPMTYQVDGKQYVTVVGASTVFTFGLP